MKSFHTNKMIQQSYHLGRNYEYYIASSQKLYSNFQEALNGMELPKTLNPFGVYSILKKSYILGDETMIKGLCRVPWMAEPDTQGGWEYHDLPKHGCVISPIDEVAKTLLLKLKQEVLLYIEKRETVGILLSGGMDSRVLAGVLKNIIDEEQLSTQVICFTWGLDNSRDVVYSKQIANEFKWHFTHIALTPEDLLDNIYATASLGAEFSPVHLHGMPKIAKHRELDIVLAASYGDSIGRAEYSGVPLTKLSSITANRLNTFSLLTRGVEGKMGLEFGHHATQYRRFFPREEDYQYFELERQLHYMRRQLMAPFDIIAKDIPVRQIFTHPDTFSYMWSLSPEMRTNQIYKELLRLLPGSLLSIPWARTGTLYESRSPSMDNFEKNHNIYGKWLREELGQEIQRIIKNSPLYDFPIFNKGSLKDKLYLFRKLPATPTADQLDERIAWLASLAVLVQNERVECNGDEKKTTLHDEFARYSSNLKALGYKMVRKWLKN